MNSNFERIPPHSIENEQAVLGGILVDEGCIYRIIEYLPDENYFYKDSHQIIYKTILQLHEDKKGIDILTIAEKLDNKNVLDKVGGSIYLSGLCDITPSTRNIEDYAKIILDKWKYRRLICINQEETNALYNEEESAEKINLIYDTKRKNLFSNRNDEQFCNSKQIEKNLFTTMKAIIKDNYLMNFNFTPFQNLKIEKENTNIVIVSRPGHGKTALAIHLGVNHSIKYKHEEVIYNFAESSKEKLGLRKWCLENKLSKEKLTILLNRIQEKYKEKAKMTFDDLSFSNFKEGFETLSDYKLNKYNIANFNFNYINTIEQACNKCYNLAGQYKKLNKKIGLTIWDYVQKFDTMKNFAAGQERQKIDYILLYIDTLLKEINCDGVILSQANRSVEMTPDKRVKSHHLKESGAFEQIADYIFALMIPNKYSMTDKDTDWQYKESDKLWKVYLDVIKNKEQLNLNRLLSFQSDIFRFENFNTSDTEENYFRQVTKFREAERKKRGEAYDKNK